MADWTDERVETLKRLCGQGLAFSAIAERMGMTRACIRERVRKYKTGRAA
ncbi:MAG TPA: GcrA family cell cycle regulator [Hyphomicrobiales bacterium]|nr:GcrA family cell cycle regulator [Hyphomicrobiales bacterium]